MQKPYKHLKPIFLVILFLLSCSPSKRFTSDKGGDKNVTEIRNLPEETKNLTPLKTEIGIASYYADQFHGKTTYSGEVYNMYGLSAAHPSLPMNTIIRVTNLTNNKSIVIKVNDRMPQHPDRIIDLSYGTAKYLEMEEAGLAKVKVEILKWGDK